MVMPTCKICLNETEVIYTAYMLDRSRIEGCCKSCKTTLETQNLDDMTYNVCKNLCSALNGHAAEKSLAESLIRSMDRQHRYLQNVLFMALFEFFKLYGAKNENHYDARNEWAVAVAQRWDKATFD